VDEFSTARTYFLLAPSTIRTGNVTVTDLGCLTVEADMI
jgi:hypothetical protein